MDDEDDEEMLVVVEPIGVDESLLIMMARMSSTVQPSRLIMAGFGLLLDEELLEEEPKLSNVIV